MSQSNSSETNEQKLARQLDDLKFKLESGEWVHTLNRHPDLAAKLFALAKEDNTPLAEIGRLAEETTNLATKLYLRAVQQQIQQT
jgi:hypothetical protein